MTVTLETIYQEIQQVRSELHRVRDMLADEGELADDARRELDEAGEEMAHGQYVTHEDVVAKYG